MPSRGLFAALMAVQILVACRSADSGYDAELTAADAPSSSLRLTYFPGSPDLHGEIPWTGTERPAHMHLLWGLFARGEKRPACDAMPYRQVVKPEFNNVTLRFETVLPAAARNVSQCLPAGGGTLGSRKHLACLLERKVPLTAAGCLMPLGELSTADEAEMQRLAAAAPQPQTGRRERLEKYLVACARAMGVIGNQECSANDKGVLPVNPKFPNTKALFFCNANRKAGADTVVRSASAVQFDAAAKTFCWYPTEELVVSLNGKDKVALADARVEDGMHVAGVTERRIAEIKDDALVYNVKVALDIAHDDVRDLAVWLIHQDAGAEERVVVFDGAANPPSRNLVKQEFEPANVPAMGALIGRSPAGSWILRIEDRKARRVGLLRGATVSFFYIR